MHEYGNVEIEDYWDAEQRIAVQSNISLADHGMQQHSTLILCCGSDVKPITDHPDRSCNVVIAAKAGIQTFLFDYTSDLSAFFN